MTQSNGQITVTFGRNVKDEPMSDERWKEFRIEVQKVLNDVIPSRVEVFTDYHQGTGAWDERTEESFKITVILDGPAAVYVEGLSIRLAKIAKVYEQDAIALSHGTSYLIEAAE